MPALAPNLACSPVAPPLEACKSSVCLHSVHWFSMLLSGDSHLNACSQANLAVFAAAAAGIVAGAGPVVALLAVASLHSAAVVPLLEQLEST